MVPPYLHWPHAISLMPELATEAHPPFVPLSHQPLGWDESVRNSLISYPSSLMGLQPPLCPSAPAPRPPQSTTSDASLCDLKGVMPMCF